MTRRMMMAVLMAAMAAVPAALSAHDGHVHTVRGTVQKVSATQIEIRGEDGKPVTIEVNAKTGVLRGTQKAERTAVQVGQRVVVDVGNGKKPLVAKSIKLGVVEARK